MTGQDGGAGNGTGPGAGPGAGGKPPAPLVLSVAMGVVGFLLLVVGVALGNEAVSVAGMAGGALSLAAALYWRSLLIAAWHGRRRSG